MMKIACLVCSLVWLATGPAMAQQANEQAGQETDTDKPWAEGVTAEEKENAQRLLVRGNALFLESRHLAALAEYRAALESWDHPAIRFNIARALINLDRTLEAYENIQLALQYGPAPLPELYDEARNYERLLRGQIGALTIRCDRPGARVSVDGQRHFECPAEETIRLLPGRHKVLAEKAGYLPFSRDITLLAATPETVDIVLITFEDATVTTRRWPRWKPWAVVGGGVALAGLGVSLELLARSTRDDYAEELIRSCSETPCAPGELTHGRSALVRARIERVVGISGIAMGSAAVLGGLALVYMNRPRTFLSETRVPSGDNATQVVPTVSLGGFGASVIHRF